MHDHKATIL